MSCSNLYLGTGRVATGTPLPAWYFNDAIQPNAPGPLAAGAKHYIYLTFSNHGTQPSPETWYELFWSDPTTGFLTPPSRQINGAAVVVVAGTPPGATDSTRTEWSLFEPDASVTDVNGGHVCLLLRIRTRGTPSAGCGTQFYDANSPPTDPCTAIRNLMVVQSSGSPWAGFGFAATNALADAHDTELRMEVIEPASRLGKGTLESVTRLLEPHGLKLAVPDDVRLIDGNERVVVRADASARLPKLGQLSEAELRHHANPNARPVGPGVPHRVAMEAGESRAMFVQLWCSDGAAHAVEITHRTADGSEIGGLVLVFVPSTESRSLGTA